MRDIKACLTSKSDDYRTPSKIYDFFVKEWGFEDLFPYCSKDDQFGKYYKNSKLFINPPFSKMAEVSKYVLDLVQEKNNNLVCLLVPVRTDTKWFYYLFRKCDNLIFIRGRLHFNESKSAPFPSMLMVFGLKDLECGPLNVYNKEIDDMLNILGVAFEIHCVDKIKSNVVPNYYYLNGLDYKNLDYREMFDNFFNLRFGVCL